MGIPFTDNVIDRPMTILERKEYFIIKLQYYMARVQLENDIIIRIKIINKIYRLSIQNLNILTPRWQTALISKLDEFQVEIQEKYPEQMHLFNYDDYSQLLR